MDGNALFALILTGGMGLALVAMALVLMAGHGAGLIAGYNTSSAEQKAKYDEKRMCRFVGKILLPIGLFLPAVAIGGMNGLDWVAFAYGALVVGLCVFAVIWLNTGKRYQK